MYWVMSGREAREEFDIDGRARGPEEDSDASPPTYRQTPVSHHPLPTLINPRVSIKRQDDEKSAEEGRAHPQRSTQPPPRLPSSLSLYC